MFVSKCGCNEISLRPLFYFVLPSPTQRNIIRILNFKALVYDLIRNKDSYSDDELIGILTRIEKCRYLKGFEYWDFEANFRRENKESILTPEIEDKLDDIRTAQLHLEFWDDWD